MTAKTQGGSFLYETHLHTRLSSGCGRSSGAEHVRYYHSLGFTGIFITDHFFGGNCAVPRDLPWEERIDLFRAGFDDAWNEGQKCGLDVFFAWEETFEGDDYLIYGLSPEWLKKHPQAGHWTHRQQYEAVHAAGGCVVQAHPFRCRDYIHMITLNREFVDAVEVGNAGNHQIEDAAAKRYAERFGLFETCGSDNHHSREGIWEDNRIFALEVSSRIESAADFAARILRREPMKLKVPEGRFELPPEEEAFPPGEAVLGREDQIPLRSYWIDGKENRTFTDLSWMKD